VSQILFTSNPLTYQIKDLDFTALSCDTRQPLSVYEGIKFSQFELQTQHMSFLKVWKMISTITEPPWNEVIKWVIKSVTKMKPSWFTLLKHKPNSMFEPEKLLHYLQSTTPSLKTIWFLNSQRAHTITFQIKCLTLLSHFPLNNNNLPNWTKWAAPSFITKHAIKLKPSSYKRPNVISKRETKKTNG